jgi:hypothetical protein
MIRTVTCLCFVMACGSGLYLYQSKHRVQVLDREIEKTVRGTETLREQIRVLHAEWTLLNDPQRLQALAEQFLDLKTVTPGQFTSLAELDTRLPAVRAPEPPPPAEPPAIPVAQAPEVVQPEEPRPASIPVPPPPAKPASVAIAATPPRPPPEHKPAPPPVVAEAPPVRPVIPRLVAVAEPPRPAPPRIAPVAAVAPVVLPTQAVPLATGSALGMAHGAAPPPPRPIPVNASQWVTNGGGG